MLLWVLAAASGCARAHPVRYAGDARAPSVAADDVDFVAELPQGYTVIGELAARCAKPASHGAVKDVRWIDMMCSEPLLRRAMRERAAGVGGSALVNARCVKTHAGSAGAWVCRASVAVGKAAGGAHLQEGRATAAAVHGGIWGARVDVTAIRPSQEPSKEAREVPQALPAQMKLAVVAVRCAQCDPVQLEQAVLDVAGLLGASAVAALDCRPHVDGWQCLGDAMVDESREMGLRAW